MSVYAYDAIRVSKEDAIKIIKALQSPNCPARWLDDDLVCLVQADDGSIIFEWETWHGSPWIEIPNNIDMLHINTNNDLETEVECFGNIPDNWLEGFEVLSEGVNWLTFYPNITIDELK